ncbi:TIGR02996 domain-containing protein [Nannocystis pusilla]|uniref:TIGR02996 domain-containing protein n=1 Tax=Nannocystis pusilla TaxID=889268 RepID=UPI003DA1F3E0
MPASASAEREFMARILADPADDAPRLAFAEWLTRRGDPRGEFIRLQVSLGTGPLSPQDLWQRADALRRQHETAWVGELRELLGVAGQSDCQPCTFRRGFVEEALRPRRRVRRGRRSPAGPRAAAARRLLRAAPA